MQVQDITIPCSNGITLAGQSYTNTPPSTHPNGSANSTEEQRILCLHGWMDNCRSFYWLAPHILQNSHSTSTHTRIVALDFVGHGHSDHTAEPGSVLAEHVFYVAEALRVLKWSNLTLMGHSMGASVACLYAATFPEQVDKLILLEGGKR